MYINGIISRGLLVVAFWSLLLGTAAVGSSQTIKVYKPNGSIQCQMSGVTLQDMEKELTSKGITVLSSCYGHDGLVRPAVCSVPTGNLNVYEIDASQLQKARDLGFGVLSDHPSSQGQCTK